MHCFCSPMLQLTKKKTLHHIEKLTSKSASHAGKCGAVRYVDKVSEGSVWDYPKGREDGGLEEQENACPRCSMHTIALGRVERIQEKCTNLLTEIHICTYIRSSQVCFEKYANDQDQNLSLLLTVWASISNSGSVELSIHLCTCG